MKQCSPPSTRYLRARVQLILELTRYPPDLSSSRKNNYVPSTLKRDQDILSQHVILEKGTTKRHNRKQPPIVVDILLETAVSYSPLLPLLADTGLR